MTFLRNRRSVRTLLIGVASGLLIAAPSRLAAQDTATVAKTHTVKKGDTLWDLAALYLADAFRWPEIYRLNTDIVDDPHWIYPGEILKLPGYVSTTVPALVEPGRVTVGVPPPTAAVIDTAPVSRPRPEPSLFARTDAPAGIPGAAVPVTTPGDTMAAPFGATAPSTVRYGDFIRAPWVDRREGPPVWGRIIGPADIPGIEPARQRGRFQMNDRVLIAPPTGSVAPERELYLAYHFGPLLDEVGQVIVPTGVLEVVRPPLNGDAAIATIVRMFGEVKERDRLLPYDSSAIGIVGSPTPVKNGLEGEVRWIPDEPVLPAIKYYIVLSLTSRDGIRVGDEVQLYKAGKKAIEKGEFGVPEMHIGRAQIVRVTPFGATAMIIRLDQPKVEKGTLVRVDAKMQ